MSEIDRIAEQLQQTFEGGAWHGPSLTEALKDIDASKAFARPIANAHSIAELVMHCTAWKDAVRRAISGEPDVTVIDEENWPQVLETTEAAWQLIVKALVTRQLQLQHAVQKYDTRRLEEIPEGAKSSVYVLLHGVIQHDAYHAGQIMLLKKMLG